MTARLETMEKAPAAPVAGSAAAVDDDLPVPPFVKAFDDLLSGELATFTTAAAKLIEFPEVGKQAELLKQVRGARARPPRHFAYRVPPPPLVLSDLRGAARDDCPRWPV